MLALLTLPVCWVMKKLYQFILPIGLSFAIAYLINFSVQGFQSTSRPAMEFGVRQTGLNTQRSCLEIYKTESFETFERLCRIPK